MLLPLEVLDEIVKYCNVEEALCLATTCRLLRSHLIPHTIKPLTIKRNRLGVGVVLGVFWVKRDESIRTAVKRLLAQRGTNDSYIKLAQSRECTLVSVEGNIWSEEKIEFIHRDFSEVRCQSRPLTGHEPLQMAPWGQLSIISLNRWVYPNHIEDNARSNRCH